MGALLDSYRERGIVIAANGDNLALDYQGELSAKLRAEIQWDKAQLLDELREPPPVASPVVQLDPIENRRRAVVKQLEHHLEIPRAFDIRNAPLMPESGEPVSVLIAIRTPAGIVTGEVQVPRDRFDPAAVLAALNVP